MHTYCDGDTQTVATFAYLWDAFIIKYLGQAIGKIKQRVIRNFVLLEHRQRPQLLDVLGSKQALPMRNLMLTAMGCSGDA